MIPLARRARCPACMRADLAPAVPAHEDELECPACGVHVLELRGHPYLVWRPTRSPEQMADGAERAGEALTSVP